MKLKPESIFDRIEELPDHQRVSGTIYVVGGNGYAVVAIDTDVDAMSILHKQRQNKMFSLTDDCMMVTNACTCDTVSFIQNARVLLDRRFSNDTPAMRTTKAIDIIGRMTSVHTLAQPEITNMVVTMRNPFGKMFKGSTILNLDRHRNYFFGKGANFLKETTLGTWDQFHINKIDLLQKKILNCYNQMAASLQYSKTTNETLHIGVLTANGMRVKEYALEKLTSSFFQLEDLTVD